MKDGHKPVWRLNTGEGVPSDLGDEVIYFDGEISPLMGDSCRRSLDEVWSIGSDSCELDIYAYETNRTKPAKYGDFDCEACEGCGNELEYDEETGDLYPVGSVCDEFGGTGYVREAL